LNRPGRVEEPVEIGSGPFGPMYKGFEGRFEEAVRFLKKMQGGEVVDALRHPQLGQVGLPHGRTNDSTQKRFGLLHILEDHSRDELERLPVIFGTGRVEIDSDRAFIETADHEAVVRLDWDGRKKHWLVTAYEIKDRKGVEQRARRQRRLQGRPGGFSTGLRNKSDSTIPESRGPSQS